jgi:hypothetical protein
MGEAAVSTVQQQESYAVHLCVHVGLCEDDSSCSSSSVQHCHEAMQHSSRATLHSGACMLGSGRAQFQQQQYQQNGSSSSSSSSSSHSTKVLRAEC